MTERILQILEAVCRAGPRPPGSENERRAADWLADELRRGGFDVTRQRFVTNRHYGLIYALHFFGFLLCQLWSLINPGDGLIVGLAVMYSYWGELGARFYARRAFLPREPSQNIVGRSGAKDPLTRVILTASVDSGRSGAVYSRAWAEGLARFFKHNLDWRLAPYYWAFVGMVVAWVAMLARPLFGGWPVLGTLLGLATLITALGLVVGILALVDIAFNGVDIEGANGNAAGVATAFALAEAWKKRLPRDAELWVVFTGARTNAMTGMRRFAQKYFDEFDPQHTWFLNFDHVGAGKLRYVTSEGWVSVVPYPFEMVLLARDTAGSEEAFAQIETYNIRSGTDGIVPAREGFKVLTLCGLNDNDYPPNYMTPTDIRENIEPATLTAAYQFGDKLIERVFAEEEKTRAMFGPAK